MGDRVASRVTGAELARRLGVSRQAVHKARLAGRISRGPDGRYDLSEAETEFRVNADAEQRARAQLQTPGAITDPTIQKVLVERARLARAQADNIEMKNAILRREYAPVSLLEEALGRTARQMAGVLEALPVKLRRRIPDMTGEALSIVEHEIAILRNLAASAALDGDAPEEGEEGN